MTTEEQSEHLYFFFPSPFFPSSCKRSHKIFNDSLRLVYFLSLKKKEKVNLSFVKQLNMKVYLVTKCNGRNSPGTLENALTDSNLAQYISPYILTSDSWMKEN